MMGKNRKFPREILKEKKLRVKMQYIIFMHIFKMFLTSAVVILLIKSPNFMCAKSMANIEQLKV